MNRPLRVAGQNLPHGSHLLSLYLSCCCSLVFHSQLNLAVKEFYCQPQWMLRCCWVMRGAQRLGVAYGDRSVSQGLGALAGAPRIGMACPPVLWCIPSCLLKMAGFTLDTFGRDVGAGGARMCFCARPVCSGGGACSVRGPSGPAARCSTAARRHQVVRDGMDFRLWLGPHRSGGGLARLNHYSSLLAAAALAPGPSARVAAGRRRSTLGVAGPVVPRRLGPCMREARRLGVGPVLP